MNALDAPVAERMVDLLEAVLAEQRSSAQRQAEALAHHARAIAVQQAMNRRALRWFGAYMLAFGAVAAVTHSWHSLLWLLGR